MDKTGLKWDAATISNINVDDLDKDSFDIFRREALRSGRMTKEDLAIDADIPLRTIQRIMKELQESGV